MTELIRAGFDVNARNSLGVTPLMGAAIVNRVDMLEKLLETGADVNAETSDGVTAVILATIFQETDAVEFLVEAGAELGHRVHTEVILSKAVDPYPGKTALEIAQEQGNPELIALLRDSRE